MTAYATGPTLPHPGPARTAQPCVLLSFCLGFSLPPPWPLLDLLNTAAP